MVRARHVTNSLGGRVQLAYGAYVGAGIDGVRRLSESPQTGEYEATALPKPKKNSYSYRRDIHRSLLLKVVHLLPPPPTFPPSKKLHTVAGAVHLHVHMHVKKKTNNIYMVNECITARLHSPCICSPFLRLRY